MFGAKEQDPHGVPAKNRETNLSRMLTDAIRTAEGEEGVQ